MKPITRKQFIRQAVATVALPAATAVGCRTSSPEDGPTSRRHFDLLIANGRIVDGTGVPSFAADVGIRDGRIAAIGKLPGGSADVVLEAGGRIVCPGFIDPHAHEEILLLSNPTLEKFVRQGVTTLINGNCGHSVTPYDSSRVLEYWWREGLISRDWLESGLEWQGVDGYARLVAERGNTTVNSAVLLGYGGIRWAAMKAARDEPPTEDEAAEIDRLIREGLQQGAVGMSTGLSYIPARYASTDELVRACRALTDADAVYATHTRFGREGDPTGGLEAIEIGQRAGCAVQISHFVGRFAGALEMVTQAHDKGLEVAADVIPQSLSHRRRSDRVLEALMVFLPGAFDDSREQLRRRLTEPASRDHILASTRFFNDDKSEVVIVRAETSRWREAVGRSVAELAAERGRDADLLYLDMVLDEDNPVVFTYDGNRPRSGGRSAEAMARRYGVDNVLPEGYWTRHPLFGPGSDSIPIDGNDPYGWYEQQRRGAFPGYLRLAKENGVRLEEAIMKATALPARQFRLRDRGLLSTGKIADLMVFDPDAYGFPTPDQADPNEPFAMATGVDHTIVNGRLVLHEGRMTGEMPGRVLL